MITETHLPELQVYVYVCVGRVSIIRIEINLAYHLLLIFFCVSWRVNASFFFNVVEIKKKIYVIYKMAPFGHY